MNILVSGLLNMETTAAIRSFPIPYYPIDYPLFGVGFNISKALKTLGDQVRLVSMTGSDFSAAYIRSTLEENGISTEHVRTKLNQTPGSVVLYDPDGKRQIYCDLKDIQEMQYDFDHTLLDDIDLVVACNINFIRPLLQLAKAAGKKVAILATHGYEGAYATDPFEIGVQRLCKHSGLSYLGLYSVQDEDNLASFQAEAAQAGAREFARKLLND